MPKFSTLRVVKPAAVFLMGDSFVLHLPCNTRTVFPRMGEERLPSAYAVWAFKSVFSSTPRMQEKSLSS